MREQMANFPLIAGVGPYRYFQRLAWWPQKNGAS
jgi:hypothetical protein